MQSSKESAIVLEALEIGRQMEEEGIQFYASAAQEIVDEVGKRNLEFLASEEKRHQIFISRILSELQKTEGLEATIEDYERKKPEIFPENVKSEHRVEAGEVDRLIIGQAKEVEKKSIGFYEDYAKKVQTQNYLKIFEVLIKEERKHLAWLEFMEEEVGVHGYWLGLERTFGLEG